MAIPFGGINCQAITPLLSLDPFHVSLPMNPLHVWSYFSTTNHRLEWASSITRKGRNISSTVIQVGPLWGQGGRRLGWLEKISYWGTILGKIWPGQWDFYEPREEGCDSQGKSPLVHPLCLVIRRNSKQSEGSVTREGAWQHLGSVNEVCILQ